MNQRVDDQGLGQSVAMQVIIERLEEEGAQARQAVKDEGEARQAVLKAQYQSALQAAQESAQKHAER